MDIQTRKPPVCSICFRFPYCLPHAPQAKHVLYHWQLDAVHDYHLVTGPNRSDAGRPLNERFQLVRIHGKGPVQSVHMHRFITIAQKWIDKW